MDNLMPRTHTARFTLLLKRSWSSGIAVIALIAVFDLVLHLVAIKGYGYFRDEFYYIACSNHLAFGYVDQPPLSILLLKAVRLIFGDSIVAIRILPVIGAALFVFLTGLLARQIGGKKIGMILAAVVAFAPLGNFNNLHTYSMNFLDQFFWLATFFILVHIIKSGDTKYWLLFGLVAGLGLENKISVLFLGFGLFVGLVLTSERKHLKDKYFWLGMSVAGLLFLPYLIWNMTHGWAHLEFIHNAKAFKITQVSPLEFLQGQILHNNPAIFIIWLVGLGYFLFNKAGRPLRLFGFMYLAIYVLFTIQSAKAYYLSPVYPILFAGGAVQFELWFQKRWRWVNVLIATGTLISTLVLCPIALPILPMDSPYLHKLFHITGVDKNSSERHEMGTLPQHYADMHGWEEMAAEVGRIYQSLTPVEQSQCLIYVRNYGEAGALDLLGAKYGLPKASCAHNNYWLWGPPQWSGQIAIIFGEDQDLQKSTDDLERRFAEVEHAGTFTNDYCMPYENNRPIFICRGANFTFQQIWANEKHYD
jgi:hypothetical protein